VAILHRHCADIGRDPASLLLSYYGHVSVATDPAKLERVDPVRPNMYRIAGTPEEVAATINRYIDFGVQHVMLKFSDYPDLGQYELFMDEVVPRLHIG
jgi:alkanesulfonate monooxygenase SsuD/methylene tetrahydromethanopterin reductase-like flavin-dependent oxidoreductase (luciferase family)